MTTEIKEIKWNGLPPPVISVLLNAAQAMDDWIATYASEHCEPEQVAEAWKRISEGGGTLNYASNLRIKLQYAAGVDLCEAELKVIEEEIDHAKA